MSYNFLATAIGSLPYVDPQKAIELIKVSLPGAPFWPQLVNRAPLEDMLLMYDRALTPLVTANADARCAEPLAPGVSREEGLTLFYQNLWEGDNRNFELNGDEAAGFTEFVKSYLPERGWVKGQVTGPVTMASAVIGFNGKALLFDEDIAEAIARGLGAAAGVQAGQLAAGGALPIIFFDEPSLTGFGSAFSPLTREQALSMLRASFEEARNRFAGMKIGVHCCGNTDWSLIMEASPDIISLDSVGFGHYLLLYLEQLKAFVKNGGAVAWGAIPTDPAKATTAAELWQNLEELLNKLVGEGVDKNMLAMASLITPACGLGSLAEKDAEHILSLLQPLSLLAQSWQQGKN